MFSTITLFHYQVCSSIGSCVLIFLFQMIIFILFILLSSYSIGISWFFFIMLVMANNLNIFSDMFSEYGFYLSMTWCFWAFFKSRYALVKRDDAIECRDSWVPVMLLKWQLFSMLYSWFYNMFVTINLGVLFFSKYNFFYLIFFVLHLSVSLLFFLFSDRFKNVYLFAICFQCFGSIIWLYTI